ncbi:MAG: hypothetical protein KAI47_20840 [Deltaproteobacteria bacterium]|nr:hypothetical protein [Deltaproteobacteria bacterium]
MRGAKRPKLKVSPKGKKKPKIAFSSDAKEGHPKWAFSLIDWDGPWSPLGMGKDKPDNRGNVIRKIIERLGNSEKTTWGDLKGSGSHLVGVDKLIRRAQLRLEASKIIVDELFSLRLSNKERIWGVLERDTLAILWWDSNHEICPSTKKHT